MVQSSSGKCTGCFVDTVTATFSSNVTTGDIIVVGIDSNDVALNSVTDSLGLTYTQAVGGMFFSSPITLYAYIYYATATSGGADAITATFASSNLVSQDVYIFELSGATLANLVTSTGSGSGSTSMSTNTSVSYYTGAFLLGVFDDAGSETISAGSGFSLQGGVDGISGAGEYSTGGALSPTDFPATLSANSGYAEAAIALEPSSSISTVTSTVTSSVTSTVTSTVVSTVVSPTTVTSTETTTQTSTDTLTSTVTTTSVPPASTTTVTQPITSTVTTPSVSTQTVTKTIQTTGQSSAEILVYAYISGGTPISGDQVNLTGPSGFSETASTNSSGEALFSGLSPGTTYQVSARVNGVSLSTPATLSQSGGTAVVVLEPNVPTTSSGFSVAELGGAAIVIIVVIAGGLFYFFRKPRQTLQ